MRGLDYYVRTAYEFTSDALGSQSAVAGGGRYDRLVETLGGPPTPGIGFALGEERLAMILEKAGQRAARAGARGVLRHRGRGGRASRRSAARRSCAGPGSPATSIPAAAR